MSEFEIHPDPDEEVQVFADDDEDVQIVAEEEEAVVHVEGDEVPTPGTADDTEVPQDFDPLEFEPLASPPVLPWLVGKVDGRAVWVDPSQYIGIATDHGLLSGLSDDDHLMYLHKKAYGGHGTEVPNHYHTDDSDGGTILVPVAAPPDASYVTLGAAVGLSNERVLTAGPGILLTDSGAGSTIQIEVDPAGVDHGELSGLLDDDHTQYVLRSILTTNGDLPFRTGGDWGRLAVGAATRILGVTAGLPAWQAQSYIDHGSIGGLTDDDHAGYSLVSHAFVVTGAVPARLTAGRRLVAGTGISIADGGAGSTLTVTNTGIATAFTTLTDVPASYSGKANYFVRVKSDETGLTFGTGTSDFDTYDPKRYPASPSAYDDEFDDLSLNVAWTQVNTGVATHTVDETARKSFVRIYNLDGGAGTDTGIWKAYVPGATAFTVVARVFGTVRDAGSNQTNLILQDGSGTLIYEVGMLNGSTIIVGDSGGFRTYNVTYITPNVGEVYLMIQRDTGTGYAAYVSGDGMVWARLEGATRTGTIGRIKLLQASFTSTASEGWWDFVRVFASNTFEIGGMPSLSSSETLATHSHVSSITGGVLSSYIANSLLTTTGDMIYASAANTPARKAIGSTGDLLTVAAGIPSWAAPGALTKANDTNVTLTLGGSPTTALVNAASLTLGWTGTLAVARGGIGVGTLLDKGVLYGQGTSAVLALALNATATNKFLRQVSSGAPSWEVIAAGDLPANGANPSASAGLSAVNGSATTWMRSDAAPAISQSIAPTWSGSHTFSLAIIATTGIQQGTMTAGRVLRSNGTNFVSSTLAVSDLAGVAFGTWTPTVTQSGTITSFTVNQCFYQQIGTIVFFYMRISVNNAGGAAANNLITVSLPVTARQPSSITFHSGVGAVYDSSTDTLYQGNVQLASTTTLALSPTAITGGSGLYFLGNRDFTAALATGDLVSASGWYEAA